MFDPTKCYCNDCQMERSWMIECMPLCTFCGNKRCPKALNHMNKCTNSNDLDQTPELEDEYK